MEWKNLALLPGPIPFSTSLIFPEPGNFSRIFMARSYDPDTRQGSTPLSRFSPERLQLRKSPSVEEMRGKGVI
jgi:hypothetical protein